MESGILDWDRHFMEQALCMAREAREMGEVPVGAVIARGGTILGKACNQVELLKDPTAHAELIAITQAATGTGDWRLHETTLYVTKEPCVMCTGAIRHARIPRLVFGAHDFREGGLTAHRLLGGPNGDGSVEVVAGLLEEECRSILQEFFRCRRGSARHEESG